MMSVSYSSVSPLSHSTDTWRALASPSRMSFLVFFDSTCFISLNGGCVYIHLAQCERKKYENGQYITFGNQRIDPTRTHLNYNMCPDGGEQRERLEARLSDPNVKCMNRMDVVVYGSWCVTLPTHAPMEDENGNIIYEEKEVHHRDGTVTSETAPKLKEISYTDEQIKQFFELSYKFLSERYGEQNVISAYVHMDETSPHMHFLLIPIVDDKKWNEKHPEKEPRVKVCAKELMNMTEMNVFHRVLQEYMDQHSQKGLFPVLNGTTIGGNRTIAELKAQSAMEEAIEATRNAKEIKEAADQSVVDSNEQVKRVQSEILNMQEAKRKKTRTNGLKNWRKKNSRK